MGVTGCGKTTVGRKLAETLNHPFFDADDFHPPQNIAKMSRGEALNDNDRAGWLAALAGLLDEHADLVLACSSLKEAYRTTLAPKGNVQFVHLAISRQAAHRRLEARRDHYMPASLVESQFATLEPPANAIVVDAEQPLEVVCKAITDSIEERL